VRVTPPNVRVEYVVCTALGIVFGTNDFSMVTTDGFERVLITPFGEGRQARVRIQKLASACYRVDVVVGAGDDAAEILPDAKRGRSSTLPLGTGSRAAYSSTTLRQSRGMSFR
jgi:hypothetical protein